MIQRIQSLFLLLAAICLGLLFKFPFATSNRAGTGFLSDQVYTIQDNPFLVALTLFGALLAIGAIFLYKNRGVQLKLGYGLIVMCILLLIFSAVLFINASQGFEKSLVVEDHVGIYMPIGALIFGFLANRFIKKDDNTVKSMDRLR